MKKDFFTSVFFALLLTACSSETIAEKTLTENEWGGEISPFPCVDRILWNRAVLRFSKTEGLEIICSRESGNLRKREYLLEGPFSFNLKNNSIFIKDVREFKMNHDEFDRILYEINGDEIMLAFIYTRTVWEVDFRGPLAEIFMFITSPFLEWNREKISSVIKLKKLPQGSFDALKRERETHPTSAARICFCH